MTSYTGIKCTRTLGQPNWSKNRRPLHFLGMECMSKETEERVFEACVAKKSATMFASRYTWLKDEETICNTDWVNTNYEWMTHGHLCFPASNWWRIFESVSTSTELQLCSIESCKLCTQQSHRLCKETSTPTKIQTLWKNHLTICIPNNDTASGMTWVAQRATINVHLSGTLGLHPMNSNRCFVTPSQL